MNIKESNKLTPIEVPVEIRNEDAFQFVYASQLYGTFFVVGAKFILSKDKKNLKGIEVALNNYKGLYNIGFLSATRDSWEMVGSTGVIVFHLQVDNGQNSSALSSEIDINLPEEVPLNSINNLFVTRELHSLTNASPIENHLHENIFDSEFYERDGKYIAPKARLDKFLPNRPEEINPMTGKYCMNTLLRII